MEDLVTCEGRSVAPSWTWLHRGLNHLIKLCRIVFSGGVLTASLLGKLRDAVGLGWRLEDESRGLPVRLIVLCCVTRTLRMPLGRALEARRRL